MRIFRLDTPPRREDNPLKELRNPMEEVSRMKFSQLLVYLAACFVLGGIFTSLPALSLLWLAFVAAVFSWFLSGLLRKKTIRPDPFDF